MSDDALPRPRLPDVALPAADGGAPIALRAHRRATVLVLLPAAVDAATRAYAGALAAAEPDLAGWDGRVVLVAPDAAAAAAITGAAIDGGASAALPVALDPDGRVAAAARTAPPALVVADQWGEVYAAVRADGEAGWLPPDEVEQWLRFLSVRCGG